LFSFLQEKKVLLFYYASRPVVRHIEYPINWVTGAPSLGKRGRGVQLTTQPYVVQRLGMGLAVTLH